MALSPGVPGALGEAEGAEGAGVTAGDAVVVPCGIYGDVPDGDGTAGDGTTGDVPTGEPLGGAGGVGVESAQAAVDMKVAAIAVAAARLCLSLTFPPW
ncbi:hypothetical protein ACFV19_19020 [Streptomyces griseoluteus]|uniref:hypothetical protein n=1 Tax=Streptomyces griseoluteus TaxID=29306 RepID=UPI0036AA6BDA